MIGLNVTEAITISAADRARVFTGIKALGVNDIRVELPWRAFHQSWSLTDPVMADAGKVGLNVLVMVAHPPSPLPSAATFGTDMAKLARRYPQVQAFEVWNEPNAQEFWNKGNAVTFAPYLRAAHDGIKSANANTTVVLGGLAACPSGSRQWWQFWMPPYTNVDPTQFLMRLLDAGGGPNFDVLALHNYSWDAGFRWHDFSAGLPFIDPTIKVSQQLIGSREIWCTEYGFPVDHFTTTEQAINLAAETNYLKTKTTRQYILSYRDFGKTQYGIVDSSYAARPAVAWLKGTVGG